MDLKEAVVALLPTPTAKLAFPASLALAIGGASLTPDWIVAISLAPEQSSSMLRALIAVVVLLIGAWIALASVVISHRRLRAENESLREQAGLNTWLKSPPMVA